MPAAHTFRPWSPRLLAGVALALAPAAAYLLVVFRHAQNIPRGDDYYSILRFLSDWIASPTAGTKLTLLFEQYFSHRIVLTKLAALASFWFTGEAGFIALQALGWGSWLALAVWLAFSVPAVRRAPWRALPLFLLLMHPQGFTNFHTAMQGPQNLGVVLLAFATFALADRPGRASFIAAVLLAVTAAGTSVNGLLVFPVAVAGCAWARQTRRALLLAGFGTLTWAFFFTGYEWPKATFGAGNFLACLAAMAGGFSSFARLPLELAITVGSVVILAAGLAVAWAGRRRLLPAHTQFLAFVLLSLAMTARGRLDSGPAYMLQDRYRLYGLLAVGVVYLLAVASAPPQPQSQRRLTLAATFAAGAICFLSYATFYAPLVASARWGEATALNRQLGTVFLQSDHSAWQESAAQLLRAEQTGVYRLPVLFPPTDLAVIRGLPARAPGNSPPASAHGNAAVSGYVIEGPAGNPAPQWSVLMVDTRPVILPRTYWRARLADLPAQWSLLSPRLLFLAPGEVCPPGVHPLHGLARDAQGRLAVTSSVSVAIPTTP